MLIELVYNSIFTILIGFINYFPAITIPADLFNSLAGLSELFAIVSYFMPIGILQLCIIIFLSFHSLQFIIVCVNWVIGKIPTID